MDLPTLKRRTGEIMLIVAYIAVAAVAFMAADWAKAAPSEDQAYKVFFVEGPVPTGTMTLVCLWGYQGVDKPFREVNCFPVDESLSLAFCKMFPQELTCEDGI